ncbi:MAG: 2-oxoglutarate dehydrogenase E1 component [Chthoniobacterales bacterium]
MSNTFTARWNAELLDENFERWQQDPRSVSDEWSAFFEGFELGAARQEEAPTSDEAGGAALAGADNSWVTRVDGLVFAYRMLGHSIADLDPLAKVRNEQPLLTLAELGFSDKDLDRSASSRYFLDGKAMKLREMIVRLESIYCGTIGAEFMHIQNSRMRNWVRDQLEFEGDDCKGDADVHKDLLKKIHEAETFETFLHTRYVGQKRFSLEGGESLLIALSAIYENCDTAKVDEIVMGMAHRGRLNVLANFLNKPLDIIFNEFNGSYVSEAVGGNGDVKYHLGYQTERTLPGGHKVAIRLAANPSHLEAVGPVVMGKARARQRILGDTAERKKVLPILVHGDAAFIGQGVVAEVFNMSQLPGYRTGGTVHIVVNNQIGFTTLPADARSSAYCTEMAKMVDAPILHVNGEDPAAVVRCARLALEYRQQFGRDVVVDIYCYRRHGHNEGDEPAFTQPNLYKQIKSHPPLSEIFERRCAELGTVNSEVATEIKDEAMQELEDALAEVKKQNEKQEKSKKATSPFAGSTAVFQPPYKHDPVKTNISARSLEKIVKALTTTPEGFRPLPKIKRMLLDRRLKTWKDGGPYDWGFAEALAFGSILLEGTPVRLSGQDSRRGTFSQRHSVLYDEQTRERYIPLNDMSKDQGRFCVYNSPLSEYAVLGFDYGYSQDFPSMLCLWEGQFGDFANGAQIIIDQFIASAESKWRNPSSITLLLPHGYEGQGPEHSSARLERFLQLCAEENMQVCYPTTPAQYFHVLRRQIKRDYRKPLILMTPKSLLRAEACVSRAEDFTSSIFSEIICDPLPKNPQTIQRVVLCSGKVYYDLAERRAAEKSEAALLLVRLEQIYPLHEERLIELAETWPKAAEIVWCQEEPKNMGAWSFLEPHLQRIFGREITYAGRSASASTAAGSLGVHKDQQEALLTAACKLSSPAKKTTASDAKKISKPTAPKRKPSTAKKTKS